MMNISAEILNRKGARSVKDVPVDVLQLLNKGLIESKNLSEWMAIDAVTLLKSVLERKQLAWLPELKRTVIEVEKPTTMKIVRTLGRQFLELAKEGKVVEQIEHWLSHHSADMVRCWSCFFIGYQEISLEEKLRKIKILAADKNAGTREIAFMGVKADVEKHLSTAIRLLVSYTKEEDENIRRFAVEVTRPIGVWTNKIQALKEQPEQGLVLLEPLKSDPAKYVQNAVANWLNDASKTRPDWVTQTCQRWSQESDTKATKYIVKRAMRTINKQG